MKLELSISLTLPIALAIAAMLSLGGPPSSTPPPKFAAVCVIPQPPRKSNPPAAPTIGKLKNDAQPAEITDDNRSQEIESPHHGQPSIEYLEDGASGDPSEAYDTVSPVFGDLSAILSGVEDWNHVFREHNTTTSSTTHRYSRPKLIGPCTVVFEERIAATDDQQQQLARYEQWKFTIHLGQLPQNFATAIMRQASLPIYELQLHSSSNGALQAEQLFPQSRTFPPASQIRIFTAIGYQATSSLVAAMQAQRQKCAAE
jgi:hypothetical protein